MSDVTPHTNLLWWLHGWIWSIIQLTFRVLLILWQMLAARLFTSSLDTQDGSKAFRKCHITQKLPLKVRHYRKCRKTVSGYLVFSFVPTPSLAFFLDLMQRLVFINGNLNRAAWQRQKRAQPLKCARIGILSRRKVKQTETGSEHGREVWNEKRHSQTIHGQQSWDQDSLSFLPPFLSRAVPGRNK